MPYALRHGIKTFPDKEIVNPLTGNVFNPEADYKEVDEYVQWLKGRFDEEGVYMCSFEVVAKKPETAV